eukprot:COSAG06_NODE_8309_length_2206_cov_2.414808_3_plen_96_part_01
MTQAGRIIGVLGNLGTVQLSIVTQVAYNLLLSRASAGRHFYFITPVNMFMMTVRSLLPPPPPPLLLLLPTLLPPPHPNPPPPLPENKKKKKKKKKK